MKTSLWLVSILFLVGGSIPLRSVASKLVYESLRERKESTQIRINTIDQVAPPGQEVTPETPYPVEGGTNMIGLIIGAVVIVLVVLGGVIFASLTRRRDN
jgi:hypothetical protein